MFIKLESASIDKFTTKTQHATAITDRSTLESTVEVENMIQTILIPPPRWTKPNCLLASGGGIFSLARSIDQPGIIGRSLRQKPTPEIQSGSGYGVGAGGGFVALGGVLVGAAIRFTTFPVLKSSPLVTASIRPAANGEKKSAKFLTDALEGK